MLTALVTLAGCQLDLKNIGTPDSTGEATGTTSDVSASSTTGSSTADTGDTADTTDTSGELTGTGTGTSTVGTSTVGTSTGFPDPDYLRECQPDDFVCEDWGCENGKHVVLGQCYKPCTPDVIGEIDAECDEPERPFCSQIGQAFGGDFDCNGCTHICVSAPINQCNLGVASCP